METNKENERKPSERSIVHDVIVEVFEKMGARPEHILVPNVLIRAGEELNGIYVCPQRMGQVYIGEEEAKRELSEGSTLYRVDIRRVE
jgi:hypothetical protein